LRRLARLIRELPIVIVGLAIFVGVALYQEYER